jgi:hypothetical protein
MMQALLRGPKPPPPSSKPQGTVGSGPHRRKAQGRQARTPRLGGHSHQLNVHQGLWPQRQIQPQTRPKGACRHQVPELATRPRILLNLITFPAWEMSSSAWGAGKNAQIPAHLISLLGKLRHHSRQPKEPGLNS